MTIPAALAATHLLLAAAQAGAPASQAAPATPYPANPAARDSVEAWIDNTLSLAGYVAAGWSENALFFASISGLSLDHYPTVRTTIWTEVINPAAAAQAGWRSSTAEVEVDCVHDRYRELSRTYFADAGRRGAARPGAPASGWDAPDRDTTMGTTVEEVCYRAKSAYDIYAKPDPAAAAGLRR